MIAEDVICSNRHVARVFGAKALDQFVFNLSPRGEPYSVRIDFKEEFNVPAIQEVGIAEIL